MNRGRKRLGNTKMVDYSRLEIGQPQVERVTKNQWRGGVYFKKIALEMSSTALRRIRKNWTEVRGAEKNWREVEGDKSHWEDLTKNGNREKKVERSGKKNKNWKGLQKLKSLKIIANTGKKSWKESIFLRRVAKSRAIVARVDKSKQERTNS